MKGKALAIAMLCLMVLSVFATGSQEGPAQASADREGTLVVSLIQIDDTDSQLAAQAALEEAYRDQNPGVDIVFQPATGSNYGEWLSTQLAAGNVAADLVSGNYVASYTGYADFDDYRFQTNPYTGNVWEDDFDFSHLDGTFRQSTGTRHFIGTQEVDIIWLYNKTMFDRLGLQPPATWDEFAAVSQALSSAGETPIAINYGWQLPQWVTQAYWQQYNQPAKEIAKSQPGDYNYDAEVEYTWNVARFYRGIRDGLIRFDTDAMVQFITNIKRVFPQYASDDLYVIQNTYPIWLQQRAAMIVDTSGALARVSSDMQNLDNPSRLEELDIETSGRLTSFEWGTFPHPPMTGAFVTADNRVFESAVGEYISVIDKTQAQTDLAMDFLMFWMSEPGYSTWIDGYNSVAPGWQPGGPVLVRGVAVPDQYAKLFSSLQMDERGGNPMTTADRLLTSVTGGGAGVQTEAYELYRQVLEDEITPREFADGFQSLIVDNLDRILDAINLPASRLDNPARSPNE